MVRTTDTIRYGDEDGTDFIAITDTTDLSTFMNDAFITMAGGLPAQGGRVTLYPSSAGTYECQDPILYNKSNIHVECIPGVVIRPHASTFTGNVLVNMNGHDNASWKGGSFEFESTGWDESDGGTSAIFFSDATSEGSNNDTRVEDVTFDLSAVTTASSLTAMECVDLRGEAPGADRQDSRNFYVRDCRFLLPGDSAPISNSLRCIRITNAQGVDVSNNWIGQTIGRLGENYATTGVMMDDCRFWNVHDNHCRGLIGNNFIRLTGEGEAGHGMVRNNTSEFGALNEVLLVEGNDFLSVLGNNFGNHSPLTNGHIYAKEKPDKDHDRDKYGRYLLIAGNSFHSASFGDDGNPIKLEWRDGVDIQSNMYGNIETEKYYVSVSRECLRVRMNSNSNSVYNQNFTATPAQRRLIDFKGGPANEWVDCAYPGTFTVYT